MYRGTGSDIVEVGYKKTITMLLKVGEWIFTGDDIVQFSKKDKERREKFCSVR